MKEIEICSDCGKMIFPRKEEYKLRRNHIAHTWEPICLSCFDKMVIAYGGTYGDIEVENNGVKVTKRTVKE